MVEIVALKKSLFQEYIFLELLMNYFLQYYQKT
jgi:hypothetical protein